MTITATRTPTAQQPQYTGQAHELAPVLSEKFALTWKHAIVCAWFVMLFMYTAHAPLLHIEVWRNAAQGRWIASQPSWMMALDSANPSIPLVAGMPHSPVGWFGKLSVAKLLHWGGAATLANVSSIFVLVAFGFWGALLFRTSGKKRAMLVGLTLLAAAWFGELNVPGPKLVGFSCLAVLLGLTRSLMPWSVDTSQKTEVSHVRWVCIALLMCFWANLDRSFVIGLIVMLAVMLGQIASAAFDTGTRRWQNPFQSSAARRWVLVFEIGLLATLLTPQGASLWRTVLQAERNPIWIESGGRSPLQLAALHGLVFALHWVVVVFAWKRSPKPIAPSEILVLAAVSCLSAINFRMMVWFSPLALLVAAHHWRLGDAQLGPAVSDAASTNTTVETTQPRPLQFAFSLFCLLLVWIGFAMSPISTPLLGGEQRSVSRLHSADTPIEVGEFLRQAEASNLVWAPSYWSDWLIWQSPRQAKFYTDSHIWQLPPRARADYSQLYRGEGDWQRITDRYAIHTLVVDKEKQLRLASETMRSSNKWELVYEDDKALVVSRIGI